MIVLEARNRVGGRVWNHDLGGGKVSERGGTFVGPTQDHVMKLASSLGIKTFDVYDKGEDLYINGSTRLRYSDTGATGTAPPDPAIIGDLANVALSLDQLSKSVPVNAPWTVPDAATLDGQTLQTYIAGKNVSPAFDQLIPIATRPIFGAEARELSLLFVAVLHRLERQREEPRHVRAQLRHPRRRPAVAVRRRVAADRAEDRQGARPAGGPQRPGPRDPPGPRDRHRRLGQGDRSRPSG